MSNWCSSRARSERNRFGEVFLRVNYMASIFWASLCLLILLVYPFNSGLLKPLLPLIALPYFLMMAGDLRYCGYKRLDVLRIYGFNLILLPVNLAGVAKSIQQAINLNIDTNPAASNINSPSDGNAYLSVGSATASLSRPGPGSSSPHAC